MGEIDSESTAYQNGENYKVIFENVPNLITSVDENGIIVDCNNRIRDVLGYKKDEILNQPMSKIIHPDYLGKSSRVIVADFHKDNGNMISQVLRYKGCHVEVTNNVGMFHEALNDHPDLIIISEPMTEFIELLREKPKDKLPKLFLISHERFTKHEKEILASELNTVDILNLPFNLDEFEKKISSYL